MSARTRVRVVNQRRGGLLRWIPRGLAVLLVALGVAGALGAVGAYVHFSQDLPPVPDPLSWRPPTVSRFYAHDARTIGEFTVERRELVPLAQMPDHLVEAFLAAEDKRFFEHDGVDVRATVRALLANYLAGKTVQGASTLTQQLCKTLVGRQKSYARKAREAILARRTEAVLGKLDILYLYLNQIYLGAGAYGVQAAARVYFGKDVADLSLGESAMLAGLPPQPGRLNPVRDFSGSRSRQAYVLDRMEAEGFITKAEADAALRDVPQVRTARPDLFGDGVPGYAEHVRRVVQSRYGYDALNREGLEVHLAVDADLQRLSEQALGQGIESLARRQGFVGPVGHLEPAQLEAWRVASAARYDGPPALAGDRVWLGAITAVTRGGAEAAVGRLTVQIPLKGGMRWAGPWSRKGKANGRRLKDARKALAVGDVVWLRAGATPQTARLAQPPKLEGALVSMHARSGRVAAMVGGYDFDRSEYNRAFQGCRQPGSVFKPLVYSLALDRDLTLASTLADTPITLYDAGASFIWKPKNFGGKYRGEVLLHEALARSMNLPAIRVLDHVGLSEAAAWAGQLGLTTPMAAERALVLGSSCVYPWDMVQVYAAFAERGRAPRAHFISRVYDRSGRILEDRTHPSDAWAPAVARIDGLLRIAWEPREAVLPETTAYLMQTALKSVVDRGTAVKAKRLGHPAGGKTGTTDAFDAWFVGFTEHLVTGVWIGSDRNTRRLGRGETGGRVALPVWLAVMQSAHEGRPKVDFTVDPPEGIEFVAVDPRSGLLAAKGGRALRLPFKQGTQPVRRAKRAGTFDATDVDMVEGRF